MTAYRVVAEQDDESLVVFEELHFNRTVDAVYYFAHQRYGEPGATILLQEWQAPSHQGLGRPPKWGWQTVDWKDQEGN